VGPLAQPLETGIRDLRSIPLIAALVATATLTLLIASCSNDDPDPPATTAPTPTLTASASPAPATVLGEAEFSSERALEHDRFLSVAIGPRPAGSDAEMRAAEYIRDQLSSFGYDATLQPFNFDSFIDLGTTVDIASPDPRPIEALALGTSASGLAEGSLLSAGLGRPQEIPVGARGSVLLVQRGDITFSAKVANAEAAGAIGVIVYNNKAGVVNGQLTAPSAIPAAGISQTDGEALLALLNSGPVTVRLEAKTQETEATSHNVIAEPPGDGCSVVAGGHYDSVPEGPGANDNASGTAVVIEMARSRAAAGELNGVCYVLFGAEEIGLIGSGRYVQSLTRDRVSGLKAMLNFDMLAVGNEWPLVGTPEITALASARAGALGIGHTIAGSLPENVGSDHINFLEAGVPAIIFSCFCDEHYHSPQDTFGFVQPERLSEAGEMGLGVIEDVLAP
jgi:hypothetical protein